MGLPRKQNSVTAFKLVLLMIIWNWRVSLVQADATWCQSSATSSPIPASVLTRQSRSWSPTDLENGPQRTGHLHTEAATGPWQRMSAVLMDDSIGDLYPDWKTVPTMWPWLSLEFWALFCETDKNHTTYNNKPAALIHWHWHHITELMVLGWQTPAYSSTYQGSAWHRLCFRHVHCVEMVAKDLACSRDSWKLWAFAT